MDRSRARTSKITHLVKVVLYEGFSTAAVRGLIKPKYSGLSF